MKREIRFIEEEDVYRFSLVDSDGAVFDIQKSTLSFDTDQFYECFFKGIHEKPEYTLVSADNALRGQAKHVYSTVEAILDKACSSIDESWFISDDEGNDDAQAEDLSEVAF